MGPRPASAEPNRRRPSAAPEVSATGRAVAEGARRTYLLPFGQSARLHGSRDSSERPAPTPASLAPTALLDQLRTALAAEKRSKAEALQALQSEMQAQLQSAHCRFRNELEETKAIWRAELAVQQREQEACTEGWESEANRHEAEVRAAQRFEAEAWAASSRNEDVIRDLKEQLVEKEAELHRSRVEAQAAMESSRAFAHLEAAAAQGQRHEKDAAELRVTVGVLTDRLTRQEQALARFRKEASMAGCSMSEAHADTPGSRAGVLPRPPVTTPFDPTVQGRSAGALRGLARGMKSGYVSRAATPLAPVSEDGPPSPASEESSMHPILSASQSWSEASSMPDAFSAARHIEQGGRGGAPESLASSTGSLAMSIDGFAMVRDAGLQRDYSASDLSEVSIPDAFAVVRGLSSADPECEQ